ncbi:MAG: amidohydrolase [Bacteroidales bacterium]|nr:amidohydrolase [Bacteroidales bacterium]
MGKTVLKNVLLDGVRSFIQIDGNRFGVICPDKDGVMPEILLSDDPVIVDCGGKTAVPAFFNAHTHAAMTLMRGVGEDMVLDKWLNAIWELESKIDGPFVHDGTAVACLEMIKSGTLCFNDMYWHPQDALRAAVNSGVRSVISHVMLDLGDAEKAAAQKEACVALYEQSKSWPSTASFAVAAHAVYTVCEDSFIWAAQFARAHGLKLHIHLSESQKEVADCKAAHGGLSPVEYLDRIGVLSDNVIAAHCLHLSENDIRILGERKVSCVHNVNSNLKISSGHRFLYNELRDAGANVCIGTDGCASSNNLDMLEATKTSALLQKGWRLDPSSMPLDELFRCATVNGAKAMGIDSGEIRTGALADMLLIDTDNSHFLSPAPMLANYIYSAHSDCVDSAICDGRFIMKGRVVSGEREILQAGREAMKIFQ